MRIGLAMLCALGATASASPRPHPGRVVRVERSSKRLTGVPRMCIMSTATAGVCLGPEPKLGDEVWLVGTSHVLGTTRITQKKSMTACGEDPSLAWQVTAQPDAPIDDPSEQVGVIDAVDDPRAHLVDPSTAPGVGVERIPARAIDIDGDGALDLEFTIAPCDNANGSMCIDVWTSSDGHTLQRFRRDMIAQGC